MFDSILGTISAYVMSVISNSGYIGIMVLMGLESANLPIPSEVIMPFAGFLASEGRFTLVLITFFGALGNLLGSIINYAIGYYGGRPFVEKYGKYFLVNKREIEIADKWFAKHGSKAIFWGRLLPVVRTFISLPAGITRVNFLKFIIYTFIGCLPWSFALGYVGFWLGNRWTQIEHYFRQFDIIIIVMLLIGIGWFAYHKLKKKKYTSIIK